MRSPLETDAAGVAEPAASGNGGAARVIAAGADLGDPGGGARDPLVRRHGLFRDAPAVSETRTAEPFPVGVAVEALVFPQLRAVRIQLVITLPLLRAEQEQRESLGVGRHEARP